MYRSIAIQQFAAETATELAEQLSTVSLASLNPELGKDEPDCGGYILFWGPPGNSDEARVILDKVPQGMPAIGASTDKSISVTDSVVGGWTAACIRSHYISPHGAFAVLRSPESIRARRGVTTCLEQFIDRFDETVKRDYFTDGLEGTCERFGAHGVMYNRRAYLLVFLSGLGALRQERFPDVDYVMVQALAARASRDLPVFGGSAVFGRPREGHSLKPSWMAARQGDGSQEIFEAGIAGILVETDLSFGYANAHGMRADSTHLYRIKQLDHGYLVPESDSLPPGGPLRGHVAQLESPAKVDYRLEYLEDPKTTVTEKVPQLAPGKTWHTLAVFEGREVFPNPPYRKEGRKNSFLRPISDGTALYHAEAKYEPVLGAATEACQSALSRGKVQRPEGFIVVGCRGRVALLGDESPALEIKQVRRIAGREPAIIGMYADGETCPSQRGHIRHWNWTFAALVLGGEFSREYLSAARATLLGEIDRSLSHSAELAERESVFKKLVSAATILTQTECCHIRALSDDRKKLVLKLNCGCGEYNKVAVDEIDIAEGSRDKNYQAYQAFHSRDPLIETREEYAKRWNRIESESLDPDAVSEDALNSIRSAVDKIHVWSSFPINDSTSQALGILSIDSEDPRFISTPELRNRLTELGKAIALRAAGPFRSIMRRIALLETLTEAAKAETPRELATAIVKRCASLLGHEAFLSLLLPDRPTEPTQLRCLGCGGPEEIDLNQISVQLGNAKPSDKGICGWVFEEKKEWADDDVTHTARGQVGQGGRREPVFKPCIPLSTAYRPIYSNYAFPLLDDDDMPIGVLNAESPEGVLDRSIHLPLLRQVADACATAIARARRDDAVWGHLQSLLPGRIHTELRVNRGADLPSMSKPQRRICSILYADIRGYTTLSQIIGEERLLPFLSGYYDLLAAAISCQAGTLDKFIGDGVLALFGDFDEIETYDDSKARKATERAVAAGLQMCQDFIGLLAKYVPGWRRECPEIVMDPPYSIGVAVHTGTPIVGIFSARGQVVGAPASQYPQLAVLQPSLDSAGMESDGMPARLTYTAIGKDANLAARIGDRVGGNTVWVTASAAELLKSSEEVQVQIPARQDAPNSNKQDASNSDKQDDPNSDKQVFTDLKGFPHKIEVFRVIHKSAGR